MLEKKDFTEEFDALVNRAIGDLPLLADFQFPRIAPFTAPPPLDV